MLRSAKAAVAAADIPNRHSRERRSRGLDSSASRRDCARVITAPTITLDGYSFSQKAPEAFAQPIVDVEGAT
jgi:hypothetical protein